MEFEQAMEQLEEIVKKLENGKVGLDEGTELYEKGVELSKFCLDKVKVAKGKIIILNQQLENISKED